jgi:anti-repressor protein
MITSLVTINDYAKPFPVNARDLYDALDVGRDFSSWIKAQIERYGFYVGEDYETRSPDLGSEKYGGQNRVDYLLSVRMSKHIAMVSNTETGARVRDQFIAVEKAWNTPEMILVRSFQASQQIIARQTAEIAALADDAQVARTISIADGLKTITEVAKINTVGPRRLFDILADRGILYRLRGNLVPKQEYIDRGYFQVKERTYPGSSGSPHLTTQTLVTGKGEVWLAKQLFPTTALQTAGGSL